MSVGESDRQLNEPTIFSPTGGVDTLEKLIGDPTALSTCMYDGTVADIVFVTPKGIVLDDKVRIAPLCAQHIYKEGPSLALVAITDLWTERLGYEPLLTRSDLAHARLVLRDILEPEEFAEIFAEDAPKPDIRRWRRFMNNLIHRHDH